MAIACCQARLSAPAHRCAIDGSEIHTFPRGAPDSKMIRRPSGDQLGVRTQVVVAVKFVTLFVSPVTTLTVQTFQTPSRRPAKAICFSSGDQDHGQLSPSILNVFPLGWMEMADPSRRPCIKSWLPLGDQTGNRAKSAS